MSLPGFSVRRPVFTSMIVLMVLVLGGVSLSRLQIDMLPSIEMPTLSIRTGFDGASPEVMEQQVTRIIEEIIATVPGIEEISSSSEEGSSNIRVTFTWGTDIDTAALDLQSTLQDEINELPDDIDPPRIRKFDIASFPVVLMGISSNLDPVELTSLIEDQVRYRFTRIPGVAQVDLWGGFDREVRIALDPARIKALGLGFNDVTAAIRDSNLDMPAGKIEEGRYEVTLRAPAQYANVEEIRQTVLDVRGGAAVTLGEVANVQDTYQKLTRIIRVNGERGVRVAIRKEAHANTVEVSRAILAEIDAVNESMPQIHIVPVINQGNFIERSIQNVARSVLYGGGLAVLVLLFFLRNIRSTLVISLAIPISIIATFTLIYFGGLTINLMTLGGLALGVGMMVDSSIVVLENIFRHRDEMGQSAAQAAAEGAQDVASAIIASTLTTLVIFLPLVFFQGVSGLLFKEMAYVIVFSLICSLLVALSLVPMLAAKLLKDNPDDGSRDSRMARLVDWSARAFLSMENGYRNLLHDALGRRWLVIFVSAMGVGGSLFLAPYLGTEFIPPSDEGEVRVSGEMETGTRLELLDQQTRIMEAIVFPAVPEAVSSVVSIREDEGEIRISLTGASHRTRSNVEIADDLRKRLSGNIPGMEIRVRAPQGQFLLERIIGGDDGVTVEIRGFDLDRLDALGNAVADAIKDIPGVADINLSVKEGVPQQELRVDRDKIADLGLTVRDVSETIRVAVAGSQAGNFYTEGNAYRIFVQLENAEHRNLDEILDLTLRSSSGELVALRNLVHTVSSRAPVEINRKDQQRIVTVQANIAGRAAGSVAEDIQTAIDQIPRPAGFDLLVAGNYEEQQKSFNQLQVSLLLSLVLVYMVMACQYESLRDPFVVMFATPVAAVGVLLTLFLTNTTMNLQSGIGCIMLGGIVVNNAILLVDQANRLQHQGYSVNNAIAEAGRRRLRPILMTTLTTILGLVPLALGIGEGADAQAPLARAVVGGLLGSTLITLVLIPAVYSVMHSRDDDSVGMENVTAGES